MERKQVKKALKKMGAGSGNLKKKKKKKAFELFLAMDQNCQKDMNAAGYLRFQDTVFPSSQIDGLVLLHIFPSKTGSNFSGMKSTCNIAIQDYILYGLRTRVLLVWRRDLAFFQKRDRTKNAYRSFQNHH